MNLHSFRAEIVGRRPRVHLDDIDISSAVTDAHVTLNAREMPRVELELAILESTRLDLAEARVCIAPAAHDVLVRLGWTPPSVQVERCGWRGFATDADDDLGGHGCIRRAGHAGRHGFADGSGEQDAPPADG